MKDPYAVLGVPTDANSTELKTAYRRLARQRHPDADPANPWAEEEFKELAAAYDLLSDPGRRAIFDRVQRGYDGARRARPGPRRPQAVRPETPKPDAKKPDAKRDRKAGLKIKGADVEYALRVDFMEAVKGAVRHITMTNGKRLKITVPSGTDDGRVLRLKGQGMGGFGGGADGDALVEIIVDAHPIFRRIGSDVPVDVPVTLQEAVLGAKIEAPTIDGMVTVTVPAGSNTGSKLRLRGRGLAVGDKGALGDQIVHVRVVLPKKPDAELAEFVRKWAAKHGYKVRGRILGPK
ncbi:MAG: J domain-containing protein [Rhodospirillales bacterium]|nr:J domain-containing protein [Rhodospirillales bacterium]